MSRNWAPRWIKAGLVWFTWNNSWQRRQRHWNRLSPHLFLIIERITQVGGQQHFFKASAQYTLHCREYTTCCYIIPVTTIIFLGLAFIVEFCVNNTTLWESYETNSNSHPRRVVKKRRKTYKYDFPNSNMHQEVYSAGWSLFFTLRRLLVCFPCVAGSCKPSGFTFS